MKKESKKTFQSIEKNEKSLKTAVASEESLDAANIMLTANSVTFNNAR